MLWAQIKNKVDEHIRENYGNGINPKVISLEVDESDDTLDIRLVEDTTDHRGFRHVSIQIMGL